MNSIGEKERVPGDVRGQPLRANRGPRGPEGGGPRPEVNPRARIRHYCLLSRTSIPCGRDVGSRSRKEKSRDAATPTLEFVLLRKGERHRFFFPIPGSDGLGESF